MKSILYAGAALMIAASIYGFIDYKKSSNSKEFAEMYKPVDPGPILTADDITIDAPPSVASKEIVAATPAVQKAVVKTKAVKKTTTKKVRVKKAKRLDSRLFSRAPLREYEEVEVKLPEPVKEQ
jgi:hypothetical protein